MSEPWLRVDEVSRHLRVAKETIYRWIETRRLPAHCVGKPWKFKLSAIDTWIECGGAGDEPLGAVPPRKGEGK